MAVYTFEPLDTGHIIGLADMDRAPRGFILRRKGQSGE